MNKANIVVEYNKNIIYYHKFESYYKNVINHKICVAL